MFSHIIFGRRFEYSRGVSGGAGYPSEPPRNHNCSPNMGLFANTGIGTIPLGNPNRYHGCTGWWTIHENGLVTIDILNSDRLPNKGERCGAGVRPGLAFRVIYHRGVGDDLALRPIHLLLGDRGRLDV